MLNEQLKAIKKVTSIFIILGTICTSFSSALEIIFFCSIWNVCIIGEELNQLAFIVQELGLEADDKTALSG